MSSSSSSHHLRRVDANDELVNIYGAIGEQGVAACASGEWPKSHYFLSHCVTTDDGFLAPRRFASDPVVGLNALLCQDPAHLDVLHRAQGAFRAFVDAVSRAVAPERRDELAQGVYWCAPRAWHAVVAIFQENPVLLPDAERERWRPVSPEAVKRLGTALASSLAASPVPELVIQLHGYRVCADGAMIAVFVEAGQGDRGRRWESATSANTAGGGDAHTAGGGFLPLRERAKEVGTAALGALTSRPKKLIHATMGRVLKLPERVTAEERAAVSRVAERWAAAFLQGWMPADDASSGDTADAGVEKKTSPPVPELGKKTSLRVGDTLRLSEAVLSTEQQWWMADYTVVARVALTANNE